MKDDQQTRLRKYYTKTVIGFCDRFFVVLSALICIYACEQRKELLNEHLYDGPNFEMDTVFTKISDSAKVVMTLRANKERAFENQNKEWPETLILEYLNDDGKVKTTFKADYVYYTHADDLYHAEGNVIVNNFENGDQLNTEELFWDPRKKRFFTERFVTIKTDDEIHTGEGLDANQDFTSYKITKPSGSIAVDQKEKNPSYK